MDEHVNERAHDRRLAAELHDYADRLNRRLGDAALVAQVRAVADRIMRYAVVPSPPERIGAALRGERNPYE